LPIESNTRSIGDVLSTTMMSPLDAIETAWMPVKSAGPEQLSQPMVEWSARRGA
jgi:hypothetical protein